jgi:hypothetical protein
MVKTDFAVVNLLGWTEKVPSQHKLLEVLFNTVDPLADTGELKNKYKLINITQDKRSFSFREFRTAVALSLPRVVTSEADFAAQLRLDPFSVKDLDICNNFCSDRRDILVDRLNESYGFKVSLKNPKSKTQEIHYKMSRDRLLAESANIPLIDAEGEKFDTFSNLPKVVQKYFRDSFRYPIKRARNTDAPDDDAPTMDMEPEFGTMTTSPPKKRKKITRGQAAEAVRKSGRLANLKSKKK